MSFFVPTSHTFGFLSRSMEFLRAALCGKVTKGFYSGYPFMGSKHGAAVAESFWHYRNLSASHPFGTSP